MTVTNYVFDSRQEIDQWLTDLLHSNPNTTFDEIVLSAARKEFATPDLREYFIQTGKNALLHGVAR